MGSLWNDRKINQVMNDKGDQEEREQKQAYLLKTVKKVSSFLEGKWFIDKEWNGNGLILNGLDDRSLHFSINWRNKDRLEIGGSYRDGLSQHLPYKSEKTEITVARNKLPEQIAKDVSRRLMPAYERVLAKAKASKASQDRYESEKAQALERVKEAVGGDTDVRHDEVFGYEPHSFHAKYYGEGQIQFEITLPLAKALKFLRRLYLTKLKT